MIVHTARSVSHRACRRPPEVDARPLYIASAGDTRVVLDGPALCVGQEERAERLFPLRRLSRIYCSNRVDWATDALLACASAGVIVVFVDDEGEAVARLLGRPGERDELYHRLTEFLLLPQASGMYVHWREELCRRAAWWAGAKLRFPATVRKPSLCREWMNAEAEEYVGRKAAERSRQWLRALAFSWMQAHLRELGFGANTELAQSGEPALARDLADILMWYLEPTRLGWLKRRYLAAQRKGQAVRSPTHRDAVRLFESRAARAAVRGREITSLLHRWLIHNG